MTTGRPRVVIDTNILIAAAGNLAAFAAGNAQISVASKVLIAALKGEVEVFVCPGIRDEYREKMASDSYMPRLKGRMPPLWMIDFLLTASIDAARSGAGRWAVDA
jgi:predicted nucleic acid-binding protein